MVAPVATAPTQQTMTLEEYLSLPLPSDRPEPEFVRDHVEERAMPDDAHAAVQFYLGHLALEAAKKIGLKIYVRTELRVKVPTGVRVPDLVIYSKSPHKLGLITEPPLAVFEIISPDDRWTSVCEKIEEYYSWGSQHIFLVDPHQQRIYQYRAGNLHTVEMIEIPEIGLRASMANLLENL